MMMNGNTQQPNLHSPSFILHQVPINQHPPSPSPSSSSEPASHPFTQETNKPAQPVPYPPPNQPVPYPPPNTYHAFAFVPAPAPSPDHEKWGSTQVKGTPSGQYPSNTSSSAPASYPFTQETKPLQPVQYPPPNIYSASEKWGSTQVMGTPSGQYPNKQMANTQQLPSYLLNTPLKLTPVKSLLLNKFSSWSQKAENNANKVWNNLKTGSSVPVAAMKKVSLTAKAISEGGFECLYKQTFKTFPNETLMKKFACYLSTSTGPIAGTLYLSNIHVAFCSDIPISLPAPPGQETLSYYKVMVPLMKISRINPVVTSDASKSYIQVVTVDGHDFWFMGFVCFDKASLYLKQSICN